VLAIQPGGGGDAQEELAAIGVGPGIGHAEHAGSQVAELEVLICSMRKMGGRAAVTESSILQGFPAALAGTQLHWLGQTLRSSCPPRSLPVFLSCSALSCKFVAVDGHPAGAIIVGEISALAHEGGDDAVEAAALVSSTLGGLGLQGREGGRRRR
jgi:hypothetical protein